MFSDRYELVFCLIGRMNLQSYIFFKAFLLSKESLMPRNSAQDNTREFASIDVHVFRCKRMEGNGGNRRETQTTSEMCGRPR